MTNRAPWRATYSSLIIPSLAVALKIAARRNQKIKRTLAEHEGLWQRIQNALIRRDSNKKLIWFHVASAGEFQQAEPLLKRFLSDGFQCVVTATSISGVNWIHRQTIDSVDFLFADFYPLDNKRNVAKLLQLLDPSCIIFVNRELWPNLVWQASEKHIKLFLISAALRIDSPRYKSRLVRNFYATLYHCLDGIFTISNTDRVNFELSVPDHKNIMTTGDTRFDSVIERKNRLTPPVLPEYINTKTVLLLGSIWPADEEHIFPVLMDVLTRHEDLVIIAAPHETSEDHLTNIEEYFRGFAQARLSHVENMQTELKLIIVDSVGLLSSLYYYASIAYIGGAFSTGVHNTVEPCVMGVPAIFGPKHQNSIEAIEMVKKGLCFSITDSQSFARTLERLLDDKTELHSLGQKAQLYIESQAGATDICYQKIRKVIDDSV